MIDNYMDSSSNQSWGNKNKYSKIIQGSQVAKAANFKYAKKNQMVYKKRQQGHRPTNSYEKVSDLLPTGETQDRQDHRYMGYRNRQQRKNNYSYVRNSDIERVLHRNSTDQSLPRVKYNEQQFSTMPSSKKGTIIPKQSPYNKLITSATLQHLPGPKLSDDQVRQINQMHNEIIEKNMSTQNMQIKQQFSQDYLHRADLINLEQPYYLSSTMQMRKPPLAMNPSLIKKKKKLTYLLNEAQLINMGPSPPITPAGNQIDRSLPSGTTFNDYERYNSWDRPRQIQHSYWQPTYVTYAPRQEDSSPRNPMDLWVYLTGKLLEKQRKQRLLDIKNNYSDSMFKAQKRKRNSSLDVYDRWAKITQNILNRYTSQCLSQMKKQLRISRDKRNSMALNGKWYKFAKMLLQRSKQDLIIQKRWRILIKKMSNLKLIGIRKIYDMDTQEINQKIRVYHNRKAQMEMLGKWRRLISGSKIKEQKLRSLRAIGRWLQLIKKIHQQNSKISRLNVIGRWGYLTELVLKRGLNQQTFQQNKRWKILLKKAQAMGYVQLRSFDDTKVIVSKMKQHNSKVQSMNVLGKWRFLINGIMKQEKQQDQKYIKQNKLRIIGNWGKLIRRSKKLKIMRAFSRLKMLTMRMILNHQYTLAIRKKFMLKYLTGKLLQKHYHSQAFQSKFGGLSILCRRYLTFCNQKQAFRRKFGLRYLSNMLLKQHYQKKAVQRKFRWSIMSRKILQRYYSTTALQDKFKWKIFARKLLQSHNHVQAIQKKYRWGILSRKLLSQSNHMKAIQKKYRWSIMTRKLLQSKNQQDAIRQKFLWGVFSRELLQKRNHQQAIQRKYRWGYFSRRLIQNYDKKRALQKKYRWQIFSRKLITIDNKRQAIRKKHMWAYMSRQLVQRNNAKEAIQKKYRWRILINGVLKKERRQQSLVVSMQFAYLARQLIIKYNKVDAFVKLRRWTVLSRKLVAHYNQQQAIRQKYRWAVMSRKLVTRANKYIALTSQFKIRFLVNKYMARHYKMQSMKRMIKLRKMAMKLLQVDRSPNWVRIIKKLQAKSKKFTFKGFRSYQSMNLEYQERGASSYLVTQAAVKFKKSAKNKKNSSLYRVGQWAQIVRKLLALDNQNTAMKRYIDWGRFTRKILWQEKNRQQKVLGRWRMMTHKYLRAAKDRRLLSICKFAALIRRYVKHCADAQAAYKTIRAETRLRDLAFKLLERSDEIPVQRPSTIERWTNLVIGAITKQNRKESTKNLFKWKNFANKLLLRQKRKTLRIYGHWKRYVGQYLKLHEKYKKMPAITRLFVNYVLYVRDMEEQQQASIDNQRRLLAEIRLSKFLRKYLNFRLQKNKSSPMKKVSTYNLSGNTLKRWKLLTEKLMAYSDNNNSKISKQSSKKKIIIKKSGKLPPSGKFISTQSEVSPAGLSFSASQKKSKQDKTRKKSNFKKSVDSSIDGVDERDILIRNKQLKNDVLILQNKLQQNQELFHQFEQEMDLKFKKYHEEVDLGKQRENKLMFFLYVLKEEKKCPVTEVFEDFIKPIQTSRFTTDYGDDYRKILKKIKRNSVYDKVYNRAIKRLKLQNGNKDYKSDSCIPCFQEVKKTQEEPQFSSKKIIRIKNAGKVVKIPTLDIVQLGQNTRMSRPIQNYNGSDIENMSYASSYSEDQKVKQKIKDIVFDPRQRKRLLDSLNIITPRDKWTSLNYE